MRSNHPQAKIAAGVRRKVIRAVDAVFGRSLATIFNGRHFNRNQIALANLIHDSAVYDVLDNVTKGNQLDRVPLTGRNQIIFVSVVIIQRDVRTRLAVDFARIAAESSGPVLNKVKILTKSDFVWASFISSKMQNNNWTHIASYNLYIHAKIG